MASFEADSSVLWTSGAPARVLSPACRPSTGHHNTWAKEDNMVVAFEEEPALE